MLATPPANSISQPINGHILPNVSVQIRKSRIGVRIQLKMVAQVLRHSY